MNGLVLLYVLFFKQFALSIIGFTVVIRLATLPLTLRQLRQMRGMASIQPKMKEIQAKYAGDRASISREQMKLYKEFGINPLGCLGPMVIQLPIWIGLYRSILQTLPSNPESVAGLSAKFYSWLPQVNQAVPLNSNFLWMDLALPDPTPILPILVGASMWIMQKMTTMPTTDARQASQNNMMLWMLPLMFTFFSFTFPSGLALYWVASNLIGVVIQYRVTGWGTLFRPSRTAEPVPAPASAPANVVTTTAKEIADDGKPRDVGQDGGRSYRARPKAARRRPRGGRNRRR